MKVSRCSPRARDNDKNFTISWVIHEINSRYAQGAWKKEYGLIHSKLAYESSCKWKLPILFSPSPTKKYENPLICSKCHFSFVVSLHHLKRSDNWHDFYPHNTWELCCVSIFSLMISSCWLDLKLTLGFKIHRSQHFLSLIICRWYQTGLNCAKTLHDQQTSSQLSFGENFSFLHNNNTKMIKKLFIDLWITFRKIYCNCCFLSWFLIIFVSL